MMQNELKITNTDYLYCMVVVNAYNKPIAQLVLLFVIYLICFETRII